MRRPFVSNFGKENGRAGPGAGCAQATAAIKAVNRIGLEFRIMATFYFFSPVNAIRVSFSGLRYFWQTRLTSSVVTLG